MDEKTRQALQQLKAWWGADPIATMQQIVASPETFSEIAGTEIGLWLLLPEVGRSIEKVLKLNRLIRGLKIE